MRPGEGDTYQLCFSIMFREATLSKCYLTVLWWIFDGGTTTSPGHQCPVAAEMIPWRHLHHVQPHPPPAPHLLPHVPRQLGQCRLRLWIRRQSLAGKQHIWQGDFIIFKHFLHIQDILYIICLNVLLWIGVAVLCSLFEYDIRIHPCVSLCFWCQLNHWSIILILQVFFLLSPLFLSPLFVLALKIVLMTDKLLQPVKSEIFTLVGHTYHLELQLKFHTKVRNHGEGPLWPCPGWKCLLVLSHLRHYAKQALTQW